ncbi:hypothetical protein M422DRAFT_263941 [Sphaerobolus stellatus SS14]|uniref:F-box domain-containing protein n=1 Tax=Sphaerobolus stellatus (strain SS14) TaxID=990650 RepID=A0A0C9V9N3_SPHS4|nr:hypothetical protein M422DRAFT_263941 [Sphaerobolus stellatus SS14]
MDPFTYLPYELFEEILLYTLDTYETPYLLPTINSTWAGAVLPLLHSHVILTSAAKLHRFVDRTRSAPLCCAVKGGRYVEIILNSAPQSLGAWGIIKEALGRCECTGKGKDGGRKCCRGVRSLRLMMDSFVSDKGVRLTGEALGLINPEIFTWASPDPAHHFSASIVQTATEQLCRAIRSWSALQRFSICNIAFFNDGHELSDALLELQSKFPHSRPLYVSIDKAVFMLPTSVLAIATGCPSLVELRLTDVYQHSIWGPRLRRKDVEELVLGFDLEGEQDRAKRDEVLCVVKRVVKCVAKTERLMGGDRESG